MYTPNGNCPNCNAFMPQGAQFCADCGANMQQAQPQQPIQPQYQQPQVQYQQPIQQVSPMHAAGSTYNTPQVRAMIGNNTDYYIRKFDRMAASGSSASWNWPAFLFNWIWMLSRGMTSNPITWVMLGLYILANIPFIYLVYNQCLCCLECYLFMFFDFPVIGVGMMIILACCVVSGILGNSWYKKQIDERLRQMPR